MNNPQTAPCGALKHFLLYRGCWLDPHRAATLRPAFLFTRNALLRQRDRGRASPLNV